MVRKRLISWVAAALMAVMVAGCGSSGTGGTETPSTGSGNGNGGGNAGGAPPAPVAQKVVIGQSGEETTLDPNMIIGGSGYSVGLNIYDLLMMVDEEGTLQPALATSATPLDDKTWEIKLRTDVTFHNGDPFDAETVKWTLDRVRDPESKATQASYASTIDAVEIVDPHTLKITTKVPDPTLMLNLQMVPIGSHKYYEQVGPEVFANKPIGTGPFKLVTWVKNEHLILEANETHWRGRPKLDEVTFRTIPDESSLTSALRAGEVDLITNVPPDSASTLQSDPNLQLFTVPSQRTIMIAMDSTAAPFDKKEVRQALNYATDVDEIIEFVLGGFGHKIPTLHAPMYFGFNPNLNPYPYNVEKAKELLASAGYPDGLSFTMYAPSGRYLKDRDVAQALVAQWEKAGIKVDLQVHEWGTFLNIYRDKKLSPSFLIGYGTPIWDSGAGFRSYASLTAVGSYYHNPDLNDRINVGLSTVDDNARKAIYYEINERLFEEASHVFMYQQVDIYAGRKHLNWSPRPDERIWLAEASVTGK